MIYVHIMYSYICHYITFSYTTVTVQNVHTYHHNSTKQIYHYHSIKHVHVPLSHYTTRTCTTMKYKTWLCTTFTIRNMNTCHFYNTKHVHIPRTQSYHGYNTKYVRIPSGTTNINIYFKNAGFLMMFVTCQPVSSQKYQLHYLSCYKLLFQN
jgi:hypothetical protein